MKVSELWLKTLVNVPLSTDDLASQLTHAGIEVDSIENRDTSATHAVLTLKIPANRGDCLGMEGIAREVAVLNRFSFTGIHIAQILPKIKDTFPIVVEAKAACPRYTARIIQNVNPNVATPDWMLKRLEDAGFRSVSVIVDIGNYVMLELGQPLHAFDLGQITGEIQVRFARAKEAITTLEAKDVLLDTQTLVIADKEKPLAIAGIIGGLHSAVSVNTRSILLESAYFEPHQLRRTAKRFNLRTESSLRFERGIDPNLQARALERATQLILEIVGGNAGPLLEHSDVTQLPQLPKILLRFSKVQAILGVCPVADIEDILRRLGMQLHPVAGGFEVIPPSFRVDILREVDLIEEVARVYGYDRIPIETILADFEFASIPEAVLEGQQFKQILVDRGYYEAITYSFLPKEWLQQMLPSKPSISLSNPISEAFAVMRNSLWPGLLEAVQYNQRRSQTRLKLFEMGLCFLEQPDQSLLQRESVAGVVVGNVYPEQWGSKNQPLDFYDIKNDVEGLLALTRYQEFCFVAAEHEMLHPGQSAKILLAEKTLGYVGALHPRLLKSLEIQGPVFLFELDFALLAQRQIPQFQELSKFPIIRRDMAIIVDKTVLAADLKSVIVHCAGSLARDVLVFDIYQGKGIEPDKKSVALGLTLQHPTRTLVEFEVNDLMKQIMQTLTDKFQATLRE